MPSRTLSQLLGRFISRSDRVVDYFGRPLPPSLAQRLLCTPVHEDARLFLVVRLQWLWSEFCRALVIDSALGGARTRGGRVLPRAPGVSRIADLRTLAGKPISGPGANWHDPQFAVGIASRLSTANYYEISTGLGSANVDELRLTRNYIVHPNQVTKAGFDQVTRSRGLMRADALTLIAHRSAGGVRVVEAWVSDLQTAALNATR